MSESTSIMKVAITKLSKMGEEVEQMKNFNHSLFCNSKNKTGYRYEENKRKTNSNKKIYKNKKKAKKVIDNSSIEEDDN